MLELSKKIEMLENNYNKADYILGEVMSYILLHEKDIEKEFFEWASRNYADYLKER